ncbi:MAG: hypothetical protein QM727_04665 [Niabella sp.]
MKKEKEEKISRMTTTKSAKKWGDKFLAFFRVKSNPSRSGSFWLSGEGCLFCKKIKKQKTDNLVTTSNV